MPERCAGDRVIAAPSIRPARPEDRAAILALAARFAETRPGWRGESEVTSGTVRVLGAALDEPKDDETFLVAADAHDRAVGFIYLVTHHDFFTDEPYVHISELAAERDGAGIGRALMAAGEAWTRARGIREMTLHVTMLNERAFAIYEKAGFAIEHRKMRKALS
jgi:ribosomal protein S18 acetylase RimI-like enzyme